MKSAIKVHYVLVKHCERTQWDKNNLILYFYHIISTIIQTLTELFLQNNQIGDEGAQYLGEALQENTVRQNN